MSDSREEISGMQPLISVCMITYNHAPYITRAISGVLEQDSPYPFELVIGDDCSTDNTRHICKEFEQKNPGIIKVLDSECNLGITGNFIRTLSACRGKYIALCEGDDFWTDNSKLYEQVRFLEENTGYEMIAGRVEMIDENGSTPSDTSQLEEQILRMKREPGFFDLLEYNMINTPTVCIRGEIVQTLVEEATARKLWYCVDYWFWLRISAKGRVCLSDKVYASYRVHPSGASRQSGFLRRRMPWIRYDTVKYFVSIHNGISPGEKGQIFNAMAAVLLGRYSDFTLRIRSFLWLIINPGFTIARLVPRLSS